MPEFLRLYRLISAKKLSSARLLLYLLIAHAGAGNLHAWLPCLLNAILVSSGVLLASMLNDYYDASMLGEDNETGTQLADGRLSRRQALCLTWAPGFVALLAWIGLLCQKEVTTISLILPWLSFALCVAYCAPPLRLKKRKILGILAPPIGIYFLFLGAFLLIHGFPMPGDPAPWMLATEVFLFAWYLEFLHLGDDACAEHEVHRMSGQRALFSARILAGLGFVAALPCMLTIPLAIFPALAWLFRLATALGIKPEELAVRRRNIFSNIYQIWEFAVLGFFFLEKDLVFTVMPFVYSKLGVPI